MTEIIIIIKCDVIMMTGLTDLTQGSACSTLTSWNTPWPSLVPTFLLVSQHADSLTWHCLLTKMVREKLEPSTLLEVNQNSSPTARKPLNTSRL